LIVTHDEHGGCYDHVGPPSGAAAPDASVGEFGFDFTRFGLRVPTSAGTRNTVPPSGTARRSPDGQSGSRTAGLAMAFKLIEAAQDRWRAVNAPHLVALVRAGATFLNGKLVERPDDHEQPKAA
jgi:phospholipase C